MSNDDFRFDIAYALGKIDKATIRAMLDRQTAEDACRQVATKILAHLTDSRITLTGRTLTAADWRSAHTHYASEDGEGGG